MAGEFFETLQKDVAPVVALSTIGRHVELGFEIRKYRMVEMMCIDDRMRQSVFASTILEQCKARPRIVNEKV